MKLASGIKYFYFPFNFDRNMHSYCISIWSLMVYSNYIRHISSKQLIYLPVVISVLFDNISSSISDIQYIMSSQLTVPLLKLRIFFLELLVCIM
jgi:hypothetical protein